MVVFRAVFWMSAAAWQARPSPRPMKPRPSLVVALMFTQSVARPRSDATFACINGGNKNPSAANKRTISSEVSASGSFESKNGRVVASLTTAAPTAGDFSCRPGQRLVLASVTYSNIVLTDTTNDSSTMVDDVTRVFFNV